MKKIKNNKLLVKYANIKVKKSKIIVTIKKSKSSLKLSLFESFFLCHFNKYRQKKLLKNKLNKKNIVKTRRSDLSFLVFLKSNKKLIIGVKSLSYL